MNKVPSWYMSCCIIFQRITIFRSLCLSMSMIVLLLWCFIQIFLRGQQPESTCIVLQQMFELKMIQHPEENKFASFIHGHDQADVAPSEYKSSSNVDENNDQNFDLTHQRIKVEHFTSPFYPTDHLSSSSNVGLPLYGDPFWQCSSPNVRSQVWSFLVCPYKLINCIDHEWVAKVWLLRHKELSFSVNS